MARETREVIESERRAYINIGIDALDRIIGGIPSGSVIVLNGKPGSGPEILAQQAMYNAASTGVATAVYLTVERPPEDISSEMLDRQWDVNPLIADKRWEFVDAYTARTNLRKGIAGPRVIEDLITKFPATVKPGRWTTIDTFSYFMSNYDEKHMLGILEDVVSQGREAGGIHFILTVDGLHDKKTVTQLAHLSDGYFSFRLDPATGDPIGSIRIRKLRKAHHVTRSIAYRIVDTGISIETATRIA